MTRAIILSCVPGRIACVLSSCGFKSFRRVGGHRVEIVDTHAPDCHDSLTTSPDGTRVFTYDSRTIKVRLEGEVLVVNGKKYITPKRDDSIKIMHGRVEIDGKLVKPDGRGPMVSEPPDRIPI